MGETAADICITGAGAAGLATALAIAKRGRSVTVLAQRSSSQNNALRARNTRTPQDLRARDTRTPQDLRARDTRTTAILGDGIAFLEAIGVWRELKAISEPLRAIRIVDDRGGWLTAPEVLFQAHELDLAQFGFNVPNDPLRDALMARADAHSAITVVDTAGVASVLVAADDVTLKTVENTAFTARLLVAADGRMSMARTAAGMTARTWNYDQVAVAASFEHASPHDGISTELHRRSGPMTTVPMPRTATGYRSSLVWVETPAQAAGLMALDDTAFAAAISAQLRGLLGTIGAVGQRGAFPITGLMATAVAKGRVALVGEAAHVVPPIGAQGLNLGFRDAAALADAVADTSGGDPGSAAVMDAYRRARAADMVTREIGIDLLNRSLLLDFLPVQALRGLGMHALANSRTLRRAAMQAGLRAPGPVPVLMQPLAKSGRGAG